MLRSRKISTILLVSSWVLLVSVSRAQNRPVLSRHVPSSVASGQAQFQGTVDAGEHLRLSLSLPLRKDGVGCYAGRHL